MQKYEEVDFNGHKVKIKIFDYDTREGWHEFVKATAGSIQDETFVRPKDAYIIPDTELEGAFNE